MTHKRIKMIESVLGSPDGIHSLKYERGEIYDVPEHLAAIFAKRNLAQVATETLVVDFPDDEQGGGVDETAAAPAQDEQEAARVDDAAPKGAITEAVQVTVTAEAEKPVEPEKPKTSRKKRKFEAEN